MFFSKPNTLAYIQRSSLLVAGKHMAPSRLDFTESVVKNLEIIQHEKFISLCQELFVDSGFRGKRVLVVLDPSIVFEKTIELDQSGQPDILMQGFVDAMPFESGQRASVAIKAGNSLELYATNASIYTAVIDALHAAAISKLVAVTPSGAYHLGGNERTISAASERFFADDVIYRQANFLEAHLA
jgi:hypothetical protein